jgi:predicted SAM-dependent methyltransferase
VTELASEVGAAEETPPERRPELAETQLEAALAAYAAGEAELGRARLQAALEFEPALRHASALVVPVRNHAHKLLTDPERAPIEAVHFMELLFANLPPAAAALGAFAQNELAHLWVDVAFQGYALGQMALVRQAVWKAIRANPAWVGNRGVLSLGLEALLGRHAAATMRAAKPGALVRRVTDWRRKVMIDSYLRRSVVRKLHVGCGGFPLPGWLNTDLSGLNRGGIVYLDATERLPLEDNTFDFIFSEHFIEHLAYAEGRAFLAECHRVLKPGGVCRVTTPRLELLMDLYTDSDGRYEEYSRWSFEHWVGGNLYSRALVVNNLFYNWGHRCLYDYETLSGVLAQVGFARVGRSRAGESQFAELRNLERHSVMTNPEYNELETMVIEAQKAAEAGQ